MSNKLDKKYGAIFAFEKLAKIYNDFSLQWEFQNEEEFNIIAKKYINETGILDKDIYYILNATLDDSIKKLLDGEVLDFGSKTRIEKIGNEEIHTYFYYNDMPVIFGLHVHFNKNETITPLLSDLLVYEFINKKMTKKLIKIGETYSITKGVKHGVIFGEKNKIKISWE